MTKCTRGAKVNAATKSNENVNQKESKIQASRWNLILQDKTQTHILYPHTISKLIYKQQQTQQMFIWQIAIFLCRFRNCNLMLSLILI